MWWDWAEMEWLDGRADASLQVIHSAGGVDVSGGVGVLKAKRALDDRASGAGRDSRAWIRLRALLELLTTGSVTVALSMFDRQGLSDTEAEALQISAVLMIYHHVHTLRVPCPPAVLREHVERTLERYSENSIVLGVFLETQRGQSIWGRVRKLYGESTTSVSGSCMLCCVLQPLIRSFELRTGTSSQETHPARLGRVGGGKKSRSLRRRAHSPYPGCGIDPNRVSSASQR